MTLTEVLPNNRIVRVASLSFLGTASLLKVLGQHYIDYSLIFAGLQNVQRDPLKVLETFNLLYQSSSDGPRRLHIYEEGQQQ